MLPTIESIYAQCEEVGDCLEWQGRTQNGSPQVYIGRVNGCSRYRTARRVLMELLKGVPIPATLRCVASCGNGRCMAHLALRTYTQIGVAAAKRGSTPSARAARTRGARSRASTKLDIEKARAIRASDLTDAEEARQHGVNRTLIGAIRRGKVWREAVVGATVFAL